MTNNLTRMQLFRIVSDNTTENAFVGMITAFEAHPEEFRQSCQPIAEGYRETFAKMLEEMNKWGKA